jgi:nucleoid-associated protein YgaU
MWPFGKSPQARFEEALTDQELTKALGLKVDVRKKVAYVTGTVPNERYRNLVTAIGAGINGIERVDVADLTVAEPAAAPAPATAPAPAPAKDAASVAKGGGAAKAGPAPFEDPSALAKQVLERWRADAHLANNPVDVLQKGSTIVLRGAVDSEAEIERAKSLATGVAGVSGVDASGLQAIADASKLNVTDDDGDVVYTVAAGDTLSHIALRYYGSAGRSAYMKIAEANGLADPNTIRVGQKLKIPGTTRGPEAVLG